MKIGQTIKRIRAEKRASGDNWRDWTQAACAERAGMPQSQWAEIEDGRYRTHTLATLRRMAAAMECGIADIVGP